jgi:hypothetical protein
MRASADSPRNADFQRSMRVSGRSLPVQFKAAGKIAMAGSDESQSQLKILCHAVKRELYSLAFFTELDGTGSIVQ